jgi:hypothetical protein
MARRPVLGKKYAHTLVCFSLGVQCGERLQLLGLILSVRPCSGAVWRVRGAQPAAISAGGGGRIGGAGDGAVCGFRVGCGDAHGWLLGGGLDQGCGLR